MASWDKELAALIGEMRTLFDRIEIQPAAPNWRNLEGLFNELRVPMGTWRPTPNPWIQAQLGDDELRNSATLAWFLDPSGDHGLGQQILEYLLERIRSDLHFLKFPAHPSSRCRVDIEECPSGERDSRVDIQVDDPKFFLIIEVKINATEQVDQIDRYCRLAKARTGNARPWAVLFLTRQGISPATAGTDIDHVLSLSWADIAKALRKPAAPKEITQQTLIAGFLAKSFADHVDQFSRKHSR